MRDRILEYRHPTGGWAHGPKSDLPYPLDYAELTACGNICLAALGEISSVGIPVEKEDVAKSIDYIQRSSDGGGGVSYSHRRGQVGMGGVGRATARRAMGFDMEVHYHNRNRLDAALEAGAIYHESIEDLLPHAQFLALHCPATPETEGLLNAQRIALLPDGAIVVNAARGAVVDDEALIAALKSGKLAAAGLDVFNNEPDIDPAYRELENVFLLPHVGSATRETRDAMGFRALDNLDAWFAGREPRDRVA